MVKINFDLPAEPDDTSNEVSKTKGTTSSTLTLTERAAKRILHIMQKKNEENLYLRLSVQGGGCSGYSYNFKLTNEKKPSDIVIKNESTPEATVIIDMMSFSYLKGSEIDFEETLEASQFIVNNPNATASCGCGSSFSL